MKQVKAFLKSIFGLSVNICDAYILEKEFSVPTLHRSREAYRRTGGF